MSSVNEKMTAIADAIREKTGGMDSLTLDDMAQGIGAVYEAGQKSEYDHFWDGYQYNGTRTGYLYGFCGVGWTDETFKPKYDMTPNSAMNMFRESSIRNLKQCIESCGVILDLSKVTNASALFGYNSVLTTIPKINLSSMTTSTYLFQNDSKLETIEELTISEKVAFVTSSFSGCTALTRLIMAGTLATNGLDLHWSTKLDKESVLSIINILQDKTAVGGTWTVTLGSENLAKLTDAEKAVATQKGWTLV